MGIFDKVVKPKLQLENSGRKDPAKCPNCKKDIMGIDIKEFAEGLCYLLACSNCLMCLGASYNPKLMRTPDIKVKNADSKHDERKA